MQGIGGNQAGITGSLVLPEYDYILRKIGTQYFVFDGSANQKINTASANTALSGMFGLCSGGESLFVDSGDYNLTDIVTVTGLNDIRLDGQSWKSHLYQQTANKGILILKGCSRWLISHLFFEGQRMITGENSNLELMYCTDTVIDKIHSKNAAGYGLRFRVNEANYTDLTQRCTLINSFLDDSGHCNVAWHGALDCKVLNSYAYKTFTTGGAQENLCINSGKEGGLVYHSDYNEIAGCLIDGGGIGVSINDWPGSGNTDVTSTVQNNIHDNTIRNQGSASAGGIGIYLQGINYAEIVNNAILYSAANVTSDSVYVDYDGTNRDMIGTKIIGNTIINPNANGISFNANAAPRGCHFINNFISAGGGKNSILWGNANADYNVIMGLISNKAWSIAGNANGSTVAANNVVNYT